MYPFHLTRGYFVCKYGLMGSIRNTKAVKRLLVDTKAVKRLLVDKGKNGWSIADLARAIGHSRQGVHNILAGHRPYSSVIVPKIAATLGVDLSCITTGGGSRSTKEPHLPL